MSSEQDNLKALRCEKCSGDLVRSYRVEDEDEEIPVAKCLNCGEEYDQETQLYYEFFADDFTLDKDRSIFKLGLKGTLQGVEYEIIGRIRFQEEDEYEVATWDEWLAVNSEGSYHYFVEEEGEINSYEEYIPESIDLESDPINFEGKKISSEEAYVGRIVYAEGELPWQPEIGEPVTMYDIKKDGIRYSIEQSEGEVSITRGDRITHKEIIDAFGEEEHKQLYEETMAKRKQYKVKSLIYLAVFLLSFGLMVVNCSKGTPVKGVMTGKNVVTNNQMLVEKGQRSYFSQVVYGPFEITQKGKLYEFNLEIDERVHRLHLEWQSFRLMLMEEERLNKATDNQQDFQTLKNILSNIDVQKDPIESFVATGDFWDEQGYDSDGSWHENDLTASSDFVLEKAGKYYIYLELFSNKQRRIEAVKVKLSQVGSVRYYVMLTIIFFILMLINRSKSNTFNLMPFDMASD